jgi:lactate dehydrogenase-like 2-hydroxyacid dehydrogenase
MNIVFLDSDTVGDVPNLNSLNDLGNVTFYPLTEPGETASRIREAEVVITNKVVLDKALIEGAKNLELICVAATGMNNIDRSAAGELGVQVKNVAGYASNSVAQSTFALIFHLMQNFHYYDAYIKSGKYSKSPIFTHLGRPFSELAGKRFGIIGLGNIGRKVAMIAQAFGAEPVYFSTSGSNNDQPYLQLSLEELLESSDFVSIHAPLNSDTENLISYEQMRMMKSSAILINTGRGGIVNEQDLARCLNEGLIAGAALDVFESEPIQANNPLLAIKKPDRLLMTPHMTWSSLEARVELIEGVKRNIREFYQQS